MTIGRIRIGMVPSNEVYHENIIFMIDLEHHAGRDEMQFPGHEIEPEFAQNSGIRRGQREAR